MAQAKIIADYIDPRPAWFTANRQEYWTRPATAFLREAVHLTDAMNHCRRHFKRKPKQTSEFTKDSQDSIYRLAAATLSAMMGHFEIYQRNLFAGVFEATRLIPDFDVDQCCKQLSKDESLKLDVGLIAAYRGEATPIGRLIADNLVSWHNPERVNRYMTVLVSELQFYSHHDVRVLSTLWQMRHAIVHTGGWLTEPDAQRTPDLKAFAGKPLLLNGQSVEAYSRRLHRITYGATTRLSARCRELLGDAHTLSAADKEELDHLFEVNSPRKSWLG